MTAYAKSTNADRDIKTVALVLRRTNLGEADRLLDLLTPESRLTVLARASRKEKSRLAGGIELFCLSNVQIHHSAKSNHNILSSAKMQTFYRHILEDLPTLELASSALKDIERASRDADSPRYFDILNQLFSYLNQPTNSKSSTPPDLNLASLWFRLNLKNEMGEELNLLFDSTGQKLRADKTYAWDPLESAFREPGPITANHIKFLRLALVSPLALLPKVKGYANLLKDLETVV